MLRVSCIVNVHMNQHTQEAQKIHKAIMNAPEILVVSHQNPDGDTLGSASAMATFLKQIGKQFGLYCASPLPKQYSFLPHAQTFKNDPRIWEKEYDIVIVLDSSNTVYAGIEEKLAGLKTKPTVINIDHHATNARYGDMNLVVPTTASTTEVLYGFFLSNRIEITDEMATALLTGIITDTDMFSNSGTTKSSMAIASELMKKRAEIKMIKEYLLFDKPISALKLLGVILGRLQIHTVSNIAYTYVTQADLTTHQVLEEELEGVANLLNFLSEGIAALVLKEKKDGTIKASLRTTHDTYNVANIAKLFGGGGHTKAAGFSITETSMEKAFETIFAMIGKSITN